MRAFLYKVRFKWYHIGLNLGISQNKLNGIRIKYVDDGECLVELLKEWLVSEKYAPICTWRELADSLAAESVNEKELSQEGAHSA